MLLVMLKMRYHQPGESAVERNVTSNPVAGIRFFCICNSRRDPSSRQCREFVFHIMPVILAAGENGAVDLV
ncbi:MAG TPA: hypothetical protein VNI77_03685 [Nitrososphaera sp.]|nr:hypothetical protein [Nitrososphaera sp.]